VIMFNSMTNAETKYDYSSTIDSLDAKYLRYQHINFSIDLYPCKLHRHPSSKALPHTQKVILPFDSLFFYQ